MGQREEMGQSPGILGRGFKAWGSWGQESVETGLSRISQGCVSIEGSINQGSFRSFVYICFSYLSLTNYSFHIILPICFVNI